MDIIKRFSFSINAYKSNRVVFKIDKKWKDKGKELE
jgi:hypothetical protein